MSTEANVAPTKATFSAWWMLGLLLLFYILSYLDRYIMTMLVPPIKEDLGLSDFQMSLILGPAFALFFAAFGLPLGWAADRYPRRWVIWGGVTLWSLATAACGLASSFTTLFLARMGVGVGEAALSPAAYSMIGDKFPRNRVATASSIYQMGVKLGSAAAFTLGAIAITAASHTPDLSLPLIGELRPWQMAFVLTGAPGALLAMLIFTVSEPQRHGRAATKGASKVSLVAFCRKRFKLIGLMLLGFSMISLTAFSLTAWTPTYITRTWGWTPIQYGPVLSVISILAAATLVLKGGLIDWLYSRGLKDAYLRFYTWLLALSVPAAALCYFVPNIYLFFALFGIIQVVVIPLMVYVSPTVQMLAPNELRGQLIGVFLFVFTLLGLGAGPMLAGALTDFVFRDEAKVGWSLALILCISVPVAFVALRLALGALRDAVAAQEAEDAAAPASNI